MVSKDIYAFTSTLFIFLFVFFIFKSIPSESFITHNNDATQRISMDFITVKQLLCQIEKPCKVTKKVEKRELSAKNSAVSVEKQELLAQKEKILEDTENTEEALKEPTAEKERAQQIAAAQLKQKRDVFLSSIKEKINEHKIYPRVAKRRHIEGSTHISFTIYQNGSITINEIKGDEIFYKKSEQALLESFPIQIPEDIISTFPLKLNIDLKYALS